MSFPWPSPQSVTELNVWDESYVTQPQPACLRIYLGFVELNPFLS